MSPGTLLIRADASIAIGTGHAMRCLALAQAWQDAGGKAVFAMAESTPAVEARLLAEGCEIVRETAAIGGEDDAKQARELAQQRQSRWIVVDGYGFGADYQATLKVAGLKVLFIDDNGHAGHYSADLVLNQNAHASDALYANREGTTRLLLGPQYALLRREFAVWQDWKREISEVGRKVLVTMGGSDPDNVTAKVIDAIASQPNLEVVVVVGGTNPHLNQLQQTVGRLESRVRLIENADNMPKLMAEADVAVSGAGTTCWEICFMGLPALIIVLAENQRLGAERLAREEVMLSLGYANTLAVSTIADQVRMLAVSTAMRSSLSTAGRRFVDGRGAQHVVTQLTSLGG